jgi:hypothetical protein
MADIRPYPLVLDDAGRNLSKRTGSFNDCTVRALAIVSRQPFDLVYETLAAAGRKPCEGFDIDGWIVRKRRRAFGGHFRRVPIFVPIKLRAAGPKWNRETVHIRLTPATFTAHYPKGRYLVTTDDHVWAVVDSRHHDLIRVKEQPLAGAWVWVPDKLDKRSDRK